jgi:hypothetical protein
MEFIIKNANGLALGAIADFVGKMRVSGSRYSDKPFEPEFDFSRVCF